VLGQAHAAAVAGLEGLLKNGEEAYGGRDGKCHGAQFTKDLLPLAESNATLVGTYRVQDVADPNETMRREGYRLVEGVENPPQDGLERSPRGISLHNLFDSAESSGRMTWSNECKRDRLTRRRVRRPPWTRPKKSSAYTSQRASGGP
jgi:hypothetical protein